MIDSHCMEIRFPSFREGLLMESTHSRNKIWSLRHYLWALTIIHYPNLELRETGEIFGVRNCALQFLDPMKLILSIALWVCNVSFSLISWSITVKTQTTPTVSPLIDTILLYICIK